MYASFHNGDQREDEAGGQHITHNYVDAVDISKVHNINQPLDSQRVAETNRAVMSTKST